MKGEVRVDNIVHSVNDTNYAFKLLDPICEQYILYMLSPHMLDSTRAEELNRLTSKYLDKSVVSKRICELKKIDEVGVISLLEHIQTSKEFTIFYLNIVEVLLGLKNLVTV